MKNKGLMIVLSLALVAGLFGVLPAPRALAATCTSTGTGNWNVAATWTGCGGTTPGASDDVIIGTSHTVTLLQNESVNNITVQGTSGSRLQGNFRLDVNGTLNGSTTTPSSTIINQSTIRFVGGTSRALFGANWGASPNSFAFEVALSSGATGTASTNIKATAIIITSGTFEITGANELRTDGGSEGTGTLSVAASGILKLGSGKIIRTATDSSYIGTLTINGTLLYSSGTVGTISASTITFAGTVEYGASSAQTLVNKGSCSSCATPNTYTNLKLSGSGVKTLGLNTTVNGKLTLAGTASLALNSLTMTYGSSSVLEYAGSTAQTTANAEFPASGGPNSLTINNSSGVSLHANGTVNGTLTISAGTLDVSTSNYGLTVAGNWTNNGGFNGRSGTVTFNGTTTMSGSSTTSLNNVVINSGKSLTAPSTLNVAGNWTNNGGTFTHNNGAVHFNGTNAQTIGGTSISSFFDIFLEPLSTVIVPVSTQPTVAGTLTNNGTLQQTQTVGSNTDFLKIGNGSGGFSYYGVNIANGSGLGSTTVSVSGNQTCSQANGYPVKRCFGVTPTTQAAADIKFYYQQTEMQNGQTYNTLNVWNYHNSQWNSVTRGTDSGSCNPSAINCFVEGTGISTYSPFALKNTSPQAVTMADFSAAQTGDAVLLTWETNSELENRGFNLYRGVDPSAPDRQLNETLIPSQSQGNPGGFIYTWEDRADLTPGTTYFYWVEDVDIYGTATRHGPVSVDYGAPTAVRLVDAGAVATLPWAMPLAGAGLLALAGLAARRRRG